MIDAERSTWSEAEGQGGGRGGNYSSLINQINLKEIIIRNTSLQGCLEFIFVGMLLAIPSFQSIYSFLLVF